MTFPKGRFDKERKDKEKKMSNVPNQISLESASRKDSTERRKTTKIFCVFLCRMTFSNGRLHREKKD